MTYHTVKKIGRVIRWVLLALGAAGLGYILLVFWLSLSFVMLAPKPCVANELWTPPDQEALPDSPAPKIEQPKAVAKPYWDRTAKVETGLALGAMALDDFASCRNFSMPVHREYSAPVSTCGQFVAYSLGLQGVAFSLSWVLHKTHHDKLARIPQAYLIGANSYGSAYSLSHYK